MDISVLCEESNLGQKLKGMNNLLSVMESSQLFGGTEECNSSESGWTMYIGSPTATYSVGDDKHSDGGENDDDNDDDDDDDGDYDAGHGDDSDDSMASDASSGPSHREQPCGKGGYSHGMNCFGYSRHEDDGKYSVHKKADSEAEKQRAEQKRNEEKAESMFMARKANTQVGSNKANTIWAEMNTSYIYELQ